MTDRIQDAAARARELCRGQTEKIDETAFVNTRRVLDAFNNQRVSETSFSGSTGYGYDDAGRETCDRLYAEVFGTESALVRHTFVNGTHAIATALSALLSRGDRLFSVTGKPYDTLETAVYSEHKGSLKSRGVGYSQTELLPDGGFDYPSIEKTLASSGATAVYIQRSRGYTQRRALTVGEIEKLCAFVKQRQPDAVIIVDNCYGEFCCDREPTHAGADIIAGSLIKNPGGGIVRCGGYIAGSEENIILCADALTAPGIGMECGASLGFAREIMQGLFVAPHVVAQALKTAVFAAALAKELGYDASPAYDEPRSDIVQTLNLGSKQKLLDFCAGIQSASPVDSYVTPVGWQMPGYACDVVMAAGTFIQGASIELSCDAPLREPYTAYLQGGITCESGILGVMRAFDAVDGRR